MQPDRKTLIILFLFLLLCYSFVWHKPNWNDLGRYDLIMSIVEQGTVRIDAYHSNTGDKAIFKGHYYSDKAPGPSFLGVPIYWFLNQIDRITQWSLNKESWEKAQVWFYKLVIIRVLIIALPSAFLGMVFFIFLWKLRVRPLIALLLVLGYSLGTLAFPYSTLFYGHQFATVCLFISFYLIFWYPEILGGKEKLLFLAGLLSGYAFLSEYPVVLLSMVLIIYLWMQVKDIRDKLYYLAGFTISVLILFYYNYLCSGNIFKLGYFQVAGLEFRREMEQGIAGVTYPKLSALWGITFSPYRGLFIINPFLILMIPGFYYMYRDNRWKKEFWICLISITVFILFNSSYYMWWGGYALGPRHLIPILPFMVIPILFLPRKFDLYLCLLIVISILFMWIGTVVDPQVPDSSPSPLFEYSFRQFLQGNLSMNIVMVIGFTKELGGYLLGLIILVGSLVLIHRINCRFSTTFSR